MQGTVVESEFLCLSGTKICNNNVGLTNKVLKGRDNRWVGYVAGDRSFVSVLVKKLLTLAVCVFLPVTSSIIADQGFYLNDVSARVSQ